jgi:quinol monooxygenase YgiN
MSVLAIADLHGLSGRRSELVDALAAAEPAAAGAPGCKRYAFAARIADPDHFVLISEWEHSAALETHYASVAFATFQFSLNGLLARPSEMTMYAISGSARPMSAVPMDPRDAD